MCLHPHPIDPIPEETARVARAAFPKGSFAMQVRDLVGTIYQDEAFAAVYPTRGTAADSPWRLMLVTVLQYAENLTDRQAAEAVAARLDWKYALSLPLTDQGFDFSVLSDFRDRLVRGDVDGLILDPLLERAQEMGLLRSGGKQRTDSTHVLAAVRTLNRLELVGETMRHALNELATLDPAWVRAHCPAIWVDRYGPKVQATRLATDAADAHRVATEIGRDGAVLVALVTAEGVPTELADCPAAGILRMVWQQQYDQEPDGTLRWRSRAELLPVAELIQSPYDPDARYARKRETQWVGTAVHLTETCDDPDRPNVITHVTSTPGTTEDQYQTEAIQADLAAAHRAPDQHLVDARYVDAEVLAASAEQGIEVVSRVSVDQQWQARAGTGFAQDDFTPDWEHQVVYCPTGKPSSSWKRAKERDGHTTLIRVGFAPTTCRGCPVRSQCTHAERRLLTLHEQPAQEALAAARARQRTEGFTRLYALRAGIEGTISQAVLVCGLRYARYRGLPKTHLQHLASATAMNLIRIVAWFQRPEHADPRPSAFQRAMAPLAA